MREPYILVVTETFKDYYFMRKAWMEDPNKRHKVERLRMIIAPGDGKLYRGVSNCELVILDFRPETWKNKEFLDGLIPSLDRFHRGLAVYFFQHADELESGEM